MKYDSYNKVLFLDSLYQCNKEYISNWIDEHIDDVLSSKPSFAYYYYTGSLRISIMIICSGYDVATYDINFGSPDEFYIQSLGYNQALSSV